MNSEQKIGAKVVRRSLENNEIMNSLKFDDQVLKGFAITWSKQTVVHYVNFSQIGMLFLVLGKYLTFEKITNQVRVLYSIRNTV